MIVGRIRWREHERAFMPIVPLCGLAAKRERQTDRCWTLRGSRPQITRTPSGEVVAWVWHYRSARRQHLPRKVCDRRLPILQEAQAMSNDVIFIIVDGNFNPPSGRYAPLLINWREVSAYLYPVLETLTLIEYSPLYHSDLYYKVSVIEPGGLYPGRVRRYLTLDDAVCDALETPHEQ